MLFAEKRRIPLTEEFLGAMRKGGLDIMLVDKESFDAVEECLVQNGKLRDFESEYGKVKGRMMITQTQIPEGIVVKVIPGKTPRAFEASFDFVDATVGMAIYTDIKVAATGIWFTPQVHDAATPSREWIEFFVEKLLASINEDGSYGVPICSFVSDSCDMTLVPTKPETIER